MAAELDRAALDKLRLTIAEMLVWLANVSHDGRFSTGAAMLRGRQPGRCRIDDSRHLEMVEQLQVTGIARSRHDACTIVATMSAPAHQVDTMRRRLMRKLRRKPNVFHDDHQDRT